MRSPKRVRVPLRSVIITPSFHEEPIRAMTQQVVVPDIQALPDFIGVELGPSSWVTVSQGRIDAFARATGDDQWIHVDQERARRESPFGNTVAHGYLTLSLASTLLPEIFEVQNSSHIINYGVDKVRLREPVPAESRLRLSGQLQSVRSVAGGAARVTISLSYEVENARRAVCTAEGIYIYFP